MSQNSCQKPAKKCDFQCLVHVLLNYFDPGLAVIFRVLCAYLCIYRTSPAALATLKPILPIAHTNLIDVNRPAVIDCDICGSARDKICACSTRDLQTV